MSKHNRPNPKTPAVSLIAGTTLRDMLRDVEKLRGPMAFFVDRNWTCSPAGTIDLFAAFSRWSGRPIGLSEMIYPGGAGVVPIYGVPACSSPAFVGFLEISAFDMQDGRIAIPICEPPFDVAGEREIRRSCYTISAEIRPANDPHVRQLRARASSHRAGQKMGAN